MGRIVRGARTLLDRKGPLSDGFYTSGQLFLEEYYALAVIGKAGLGTPHMDGNTRLCTATAGEAMKESFGCRRPAGLVHRHRALRRDLPLRPQHGRDTDGALVPDPGPALAARTRRRWSAWIRATPRSPARPSAPAGSTSPSGPAPTWRS